MTAAIDVADRASAAAREIRSQGFCILPNAAPREARDGLQADLAPCFDSSAFGRGPFWGETTKRFGRLLARSRHARTIASLPLIVGLARELLGCEPQLNLTQAIGIGPGSPHQAPHRDDEMWASRKTGDTLLVNVMWPIDDFDATNGATRIWPGSHRDRGLAFSEGDAIHAVAPAGSAIVYLGETLHAGGANRSVRQRRGAVFGYCADWLLPSENPWLAYPPEVARTFEPEIGALIGYRSRAAGLNNWEGRCPSEWLDGTPAEVGFENMLSADQTERVLAYTAAMADAA